MKRKISVIGAGSGIFSLNMIRDICLTPNLIDSEICFMDIDEERLDASYTLCRRFSEETGVKLEITKTADRIECLTGADYVINTVLIGGYQGWKEGWALGKKWGYRFGGSMHIMHDEAFWINFYQLRMMEEILLDIKRVCPDAWYIMIANPVMAGITYLQRKYPEMKTVGLCHGYGGIFELAEELGMDRKDITFQIPGVNHFVWLNSFCHKGEDAMPAIEKWVSSGAAKTFGEECGTSCGIGPKAVDSFKRYGLFPIGDTANPGGGAWGSWYHTSPEVEREWNEDPDAWFRGYFEYSTGQVENIKKAAYSEDKVSGLIDAGYSNEPMIPLIESLSCDIERVIILNTLNDSEYVPGIPRDFEVEIPALVSKRGIQGIKTLPLPKSILSRMMRDRVAPVEMELAAFEGHDKNLLIDLIMMDPFNISRAQAEGFLEDILNLPYHAEMKEYYK